MNTHLQLSALLYVGFIAFIYFQKKKINTLENSIYKNLIIFMLATIVMDLISTTYALGNPITATTKMLIKMYLWMLASWVYIFSYYVFCISSPKNVGLGTIDYKEHPHREYFQKHKKATSIGIIIICLWISLVEINVYVRGELFHYDGPAMIIAFISTGIGVISWLVSLLKNIKNVRQKKFIPVIAFFFLSIIAIILQYLIPNLSIVTPMAAFITVLVYFTMENPDVIIIEKLNVAKEKAEKANNAKTDFLSSMSHEIRTPLNAIVGFGQALAKEDISGTAKEEVKDIIMASNNLLEIVNGILDISKIEANNIEITNVDYSTEKLFKDIKSLINARIGSKIIEFKTDIDSKLPAVLYGDSMRVKQIIINLLTNAVKYTDEGEIKLTVRSYNRNKTSRLFITVEDTGMGMTKEDLEQLFTKFQRFDMNKNASVEGTGLGMAITKGLVELMNGDIDVRSEYGKGSIFTVEIEQQISDKKVKDIADQETIGIVEPFNASGQKVLVVDDNKINLKVAERLLREYKLSIELVLSGSECINKILDGKKYDIIFLDIMMPKMKGPEVLKNLKNIIGFKTPVVALTADVISGMEEKYISQGFDECLAKPIVEEELYKILKKYLKETKSSKETSNKKENNKETFNIKILEKNGVNVNQGLELLKDMEMYNLTIQEFYEELEQKLTDLNNYRKADDLDSYSILAHSLKTEARYLGFNDFADMAYDHEIASKENNKEFINKNYSELKMEAIKIDDLIKQYLNK